MSPVFAAKLQAVGRKRVPLDEVKRIFFELRPELKSHPERMRFLREALDTLQVAGDIRYPVGKYLWRQFGAPLPDWIELLSAANVLDEDYSKVPWLKEFGFWPNLKHPGQLEAAKAINMFLLRRRHDLIPVPVRERSLEIFGDEKRLDCMIEGSALFNGRLSLAAIGALEVLPPLPYSAVEAPSRPLLVVENHHSYWSFSRWNQETRRYAAVVYGSGNAFRRSGRALDDVLGQVQGRGIEYLGDIDPAGIGIPSEVDAERMRAGLPRLMPATEFYAWLLEKGVRRPLEEDVTEPRRASVLRWLPHDIAHGIIALFGEMRWIPQESLGYEALLAVHA